MKLTNILDEIKVSDDQKWQWHLRKPQLKKMLYKKITPLTRGFFKDNAWQNVKKVWNVLDATGLEWYIDKAFYGDQEYDKTFPPERKQWFFTIEFKNQNGRPDKIIGQLVAAGAGSTDDPLEKYDITVVLT